MIKQLPLFELYAKKVGSVNPLNFETEEFELYSIPAYETGVPEKLLGREIGSSKKKLEGGDVLLSRIVPHIRRCWIVPDKKDLRQIGSGEWIVFRSNEIDSSYLRHYLMSDVFHAKFMNTVKGVGGSLLRADPKLTGKLQIPLPPIAIQKKIAAILDAADAHRHKTKQLLTKYDELGQSLFLELFGDPVTNPKGWKKCSGSELFEVRGRVGWKGYKKTDLVEAGPLVLGATHLKSNGQIDLSKPVYLSEEKFEESPEIKIELNDLLFTQRGNTLAKVALVESDLGKATINPVILILRPKNISPLFLKQLMLNNKVKETYVNSSSSSAQPMITQKTMNEFKLINPPKELQLKFEISVKQVQNSSMYILKTILQAENLFNSLLQKAFKGELVKEAVKNENTEAPFSATTSRNSLGLDRF